METLQKIKDFCQDEINEFSVLGYEPSKYQLGYNYAINDIKEIYEEIPDNSHQIEKLEADKRELVEILERMKINIQFTSERGFGKLLTLEEVDKFTDEIEELLNRLKK